MARAKPRYLEAKIQKDFVAAIKTIYPGLLFFHIPNGGKRGMIEAKIFKAMGVKAGVFDLFIVEPSREFHGLFMETKSPGNNYSENQEDFKLEATIRGYHCDSYTSLHEGMKILEWYLDVRKN